ncbi:MAG: MFS transporter [Clostridia bacterium]|nr:MFS transporter [Clostridia bacterium]
MKTRRLTKKEMWIFAVGQLGWSILGGIINTWLVTFYLPTNEKATFYIPTGLVVFGVLTVLGIITFVCRIFDAVTDPWIASLSDRSRNPKGRRIPFMQKAAIPFAIVTVLVFFAPVEAISTINIIWILVFLILFYLFMTMYCTPYNALISEFGKTQEDRMFISTAISLTFFFGTLIAYLPFIFAGPLQASVSYAWSYRIWFIILAVIALVCLLVPCFKLKEKDFVDAKPSESNALNSLTNTFKNRDFRRFAASDIAYWIGLTLFQTGLPFFVKVSMQLDEFYTTVFLGGMTVLSACFYPFVSKLVAKHGKKKLVIIGFLGLALAYVITALIGVIPGLTGLVPGALIVVIAAFPMALLGIIPQAIVADVAEEDAIVTGEKREGMFFAARTFAMKFGQSIAMLVFTSLAVLGTAQDLTSNDLKASPEGLRIVAIVAVCFCVLGAVILTAYDEKKVLSTIQSNENKE